MPSTGEMAPYGAEGVIVGRIALENARATAKYSRPVLIEQDSASQPSQANAAAVDLLAPPNPVQIIVGEINSADTASMLGAARSAHVPVLAPTASMISLTKMSDQVFRIWPSDAYEATKMEEYIQSQGVKKVGLLYIQVPYGEELAAFFAEQFKKVGGQVTMESYPPNTLDFKPLLLRVRDIDDLYIVSYIEDAALLLKQAYELRASTGRKIRFFGTSVLDSPRLIEKAGIASEGLTFAVVQPGELGDAGRRAQFTSQYEVARRNAQSASLQAAASEPGFAAFHVYDATTLAFSACDASARNGAPSGPQITTYLRNMPVTLGVTGQIRFDQKGDLLAERTVVFKRVLNGKIVPLSTK